MVSTTSGTSPFDCSKGLHAWVHDAEHNVVTCRLCKERLEDHPPPAMIDPQTDQVMIDMIREHEDRTNQMAKAQEDAETTGHGYLVMDAMGKLTRLDPSKVFLDPTEFGRFTADITAWEAAQKRKENQS